MIPSVVTGQSQQGLADLLRLSLLPSIVYQAPWIRCDREKDYEVAWKHFAERFGKEDE